MKSLGMLMLVALVMGIGQVASGQESSQRDQLRIAVQQICPVSGNELGAHGAPVKVQVGQETVFLCCQGCLQRKVNAQHWATIHANVAKAQGKCPVMDKPLPASPKWTVAEGQIVYVCCPPCTKKITADPKMYLQKVDALYSASLQARRVSR